MPTVDKATIAVPALLHATPLYSVAHAKNGFAVSVLQYPVRQ
jgi:hypothetical protein